MMGEIRYIKTSEADIELLMQVRLEMLREVMICQMSMCMMKHL